MKIDIEAMGLLVREKEISTSVPLTPTMENSNANKDCPSRPPVTVLHLGPFGSKFEDSIRTDHTSNRITDELGRFHLSKKTIQRYGQIELPKHLLPDIKTTNLGTFALTTMAGPIIYGGIHLLAFISGFSDDLEQRL